MSLRIILMAGGVAAVAAVSAGLWITGGRHVSIDDAYVHADKLMVTTDVSGLVQAVDVREGDVVKAGEVLFRLDPQPFRIALDNAEAQLAATTLTVRAMKVDYQRMLSDIEAQKAVVANDQAAFARASALVKENYVARSSFDQARFALEGDQRKLESLKHDAQSQLVKLGGDPDLPAERHPQYLQARAQADEARRQLDHAVVRAPFDGIVTQVSSLQPGQLLVAQTAALTNQGAVGLVSTGHVWIDANVKETDLTWVKPGDPVSIAVDTYPGRAWRGTVETISPASGAEFSILPAQNASGNWVKVVQRIPLRVRVEPVAGDPPLRAGMSAVVDIDTGHRRSFADLL